MSGLELKGWKGLQGLDTLLNDAKEQTPKQSISNLSVDVLISGKYQPRTEFNDEALSDLAASIKAQGIIQPLIVRNLTPDQYEIIAGERRWRAAKIAGLTTVPAIIRNVSDETALAFALIENIQREALNPIEEAFSLVRLKDEFLMTHEEIAERVGRSRSAVTNLMRLLSLDEEVKDWLRIGKIEMGHARALLSLNLDTQLIAAKKIIEKGMSVREAERLVQKIKLPQATSIEKHSSIWDEKVNMWTQILSEQLASTVKIRVNTKGEGSVVIPVHSPEDIEWLIKNFKIN
jgi:ParB family chromosome partitioning protein